MEKLPKSMTLRVKLLATSRVKALSYDHFCFWYMWIIWQMSNLATMPINMPRINNLSAAKRWIQWNRTIVWIHIYWFYAIVNLDFHHCWSMVPNTLKASYQLAFHSVTFETYYIRRIWYKRYIGRSISCLEGVSIIGLRELVCIDCLIPHRWGWDS